MKRDKKITQFAKKLVELSKDSEGVVTRGKVDEVLAGLKQAQPRHYLLLLKSYLEYMRRAIALQTAAVAAPAALSEDALHAIEAHFSQVYGRAITATTRTDASLIAGVRVRVGDDLYDASIAGRLNRLAEQVN
jgi:F-type H+-transporting ATPase subunit delta